MINTFARQFGTDKMASFAAKFIFYCAILAVFSVKAQGTRNQAKAKNVVVSSYLMKLYNIWANQSNQTNNGKIPTFNATSVRAMYFTTIKKINKNLTKLTIDTYGGKKKITVKRDELHLYMIKPNTSSQVQTFTIKIRDSLTSILMATQTITLANSAWYTIPMNGKVQNWFNTVQPKMSLNVELTFENAISTQGYPSIGTSLLEQPYLIVYMDD